jgi:hypothetical protein
MLECDGLAKFGLQGNDLQDDNRRSATVRRFFAKGNFKTPVGGYS